MSDKIDLFAGEHFWLSNFSECTVFYGDFGFETVEHAFQAAKWPVEKWPQFRGITAGQAKRLGRQAPRLKDWDQRRVEVMRTCLASKFRNPELRAKLKATGTVHLEEGNTWGDRYWGTVDGKGENMLGKLLMELRTRLLPLVYQAPDPSRCAHDCGT